MELESPESPLQNDEEPLFIEDRTPSDVSTFNSERSIVREPENYIRIDNVKVQPEESAPISVGHGPSGNEALKDEKIVLADDLLFVMEDRSPQLSGQELQSPRYRICENFLKLEEQNESSAKRKKLMNSCWNCDETTHSLSECKQPRDHAKVSRNRREFMASKPTMPQYRRYHVDEGQRLGHLVPGQMSSVLRRALGLDARELPGHIYMMRRLGYPPGWLEEARISHSGIAMFDGQGNVVAEPGSEEVQQPQVGLDKYDVRKIHRYPGFNIPPPPDTYDDRAYYQVPPLSHQQSVEVMMERLSGRTVAGSYKRKKLSLDTTASIDESSQSVESQDMDYEETPEAQELPEDHCKFMPPLPDEEDLPPPPPTELPPEPDNSPSDSQSLAVEMEDTSLVELEEQKKQLLSQLNDVSPLCSTPESRVGKIKSLDLGTPILKSVSPYARLPTADKFSVNICDVINFENLPDSTGKYEQMSGLIRKVRRTLSKINNSL